MLQRIEKKRERRKPKDRDFIQTIEGLLFCVVGYLHPPDKYTAYLKYVPAAQGKWHKDNVSYTRILARYNLSSVRDTLQYLEEYYPHYVHYCPVRDMKFSMVPTNYIEKYYVPEERLQEIIAAPQDPLEKAIAELAGKIAEGAQVGVEDLGVTGSVLLGIHNPAFSDIDLIVYGRQNALRVKEFLIRSRSSAKREGETCSLPTAPDSSPSTLRKAQIKGLSEEEMGDLCRKFEASHPDLSTREVQYFINRKWNYLRLGDRYFSVHPTRNDVEITERYGERTYRDEGTAWITATVADTSEALFTPAVYRVKDVQVLDREAVAIQEIISYEGLYVDAVDAGDEIEAEGKLESVNGDYHRLVIGVTRLRGGGYLKPRCLATNG